jgi:hypothetical protein
MELGSSVSLLWYVTISLDLILAALVVRRRVVNSFPFFTLFVLVSIVRSIFLWAAYHWTGYTSSFAFHAFWSSQVVLLISRGAVCAELCWHVLRPFSGLWSVARRVLSGCAVAIVIYAVLDSLRVISHSYTPVIAAERGLELSISVVLVSLLLVALRYKIVIQRVSLLLVTGLCFYSLVQTLNNVLIHWLNGILLQEYANHFSWWNSFRMVSFQITVSLWVLAFVSKASAPEDKPVEMVPEVYVRHVEVVSQKLQDLDQELEEIIRR